jgi:hypothetical protein
MYDNKRAFALIGITLLPRNNAARAERKWNSSKPLTHFVARIFLGERECLLLLSPVRSRNAGSRHSEDWQWGESTKLHRQS